MSEETKTKRRGPIGAEFTSPGPVYGLPPIINANDNEKDLRYKREPTWKFGCRTKYGQSNVGPGPIYNFDSNLMRTGNEAGHAFSLSSRYVYQNKYITPDPGRYNTENSNRQVWKSCPSFSFGTRNDSRKIDTVPGPEKYSPDAMLTRTVRSNKPSAPSFSMYSRNKVGGFSEDLNKTPGPGAYSVPDPYTVKRRLPNVVIAGRIPIPGDNTQKPGPGQYNVKSDPGPSYSFGRHHSQYRGLLIVNGDIED